MNPFGHGRHLNRSDFDELLRNTVRNCGLGPKRRLVLEKGKFKGIQRNSEGLWSIDMEFNGERKDITAKWVLDASGRQATVATKVCNLGSSLCLC